MNECAKAGDVFSLQLLANVQTLLLAHGSHTMHNTRTTTFILARAAREMSDAKLCACICDALSKCNALNQEQRVPCHVSAMFQSERRELAWCLRAHNMGVVGGREKMCLFEAAWMKKQVAI